jgi:hypothetical protein
MSESGKDEKGRTAGFGAQATKPVNLMLTNYKYLTTIDYPVSGSEISSGSFTQFWMAQTTSRSLARLTPTQP